MGNRTENQERGPESASEASGESDPHAGTERRTDSADHPETHTEIRFDDKGNPVWEVRADTPRRRKDDDTIDLLKTLDVESLSLEGDEEQTEVPGYDPYGHVDDD